VRQITGVSGRLLPSIADAGDAQPARDVEQHAMEAERRSSVGVSGGGVHPEGRALGDKRFSGVAPSAAGAIGIFAEWIYRYLISVRWAYSLSTDFWLAIVSCHSDFVTG
jgi:hypothetical protein